MRGLRLVPEPREKLGDRLYGQIMQQIMSGALREGEKLPSENAICAAFQVSRPTVREALMRLSADGLVTTRHGAGRFVQKRPPEQLAHLAEASDMAGLLRCLEVRIALEGQAAALAARHCSPEQLDDIRAALGALRACVDAGEVAAGADFAFHHAVALASGNGLFAALLRTLDDTIRHGMTVALGLTRAGSRERAQRVLEEHESVVVAIAQDDADGAGLAMRYHLHRARQRVTDWQRDQ